jgi:hypothetical protein
MASANRFTAGGGVVTDPTGIKGGLRDLDLPAARAARLCNQLHKLAAERDTAKLGRPAQCSAAFLAGSAASICRRARVNDRTTA